MRSASTVLVASLLVVAACGGDDSGESTIDATIEPTPTAASVEPTPTATIEAVIEPVPEVTAVEPKPAATIDSTIEPTPVGTITRPWHHGDSHGEPEGAAQEFFEFLGFDPQLTELEKFVQGDIRSGEIQIVSPWETVDDVFRPTVLPVVFDDSDSWKVIAAATDALTVSDPAVEAVVASPLDVVLRNETSADEILVELWTDGAPRPVASGSYGFGGSSGMFTVGVDGIVRLDWSGEVSGAATLVVHSRIALEPADLHEDPTDVPMATLAVEAFRLELDPDAEGSAMFLDPVGDRRQDILYQPGGARLSVFESGACTGEPRPTVVTGGGFASTLRHGLTSRGYVVVEVDWRSRSHTSSLDDSIVQALDLSSFDLGVALRWLRAHADELCLDEHRIAVAGSSFGAITALLVAYLDDDFAAGDTITIPGLEGSAEVSSPPSEPPAELVDFSDEPNAAVSFAGFALAHTIDDGEPPVLMIHGRNDTTIPFALAEQTCASAAAVGVTCELLAHDAGHRSPTDTATLDRVDEFLRRELAIADAG